MYNIRMDYDFENESGLLNESEGRNESDVRVNRTKLGGRVHNHQKLAQLEWHQSHHCQSIAMGEWTLN
jgi:hypothetical protein